MEQCHELSISSCQPPTGASHWGFGEEVPSVILPSHRAGNKRAKKENGDKIENNPKKKPTQQFLKIFL